MGRQHPWSPSYVVISQTQILPTEVWASLYPNARTRGQNLQVPSVSFTSHWCFTKGQGNIGKSAYNSIPGGGARFGKHAVRHGTAWYNRVVLALAVLTINTVHAIHEALRKEIITTQRIVLWFITGSWRLDVIQFGKLRLGLIQYGINKHWLDRIR